MKKALTIGVVGAALAVTLPFVFAGAKSETGFANDARPESKVAVSVRIADADVVVPAYTRAPHIIHVPQAFERDRVDSRASVDSNPPEDDDDIVPPRRAVVAPPAVRTTPRWGAHAEPQRIEKPYVAPLHRVEKPATQEPRTEKRTVRHIDMSKPKAESASRPPILQPPGPRRAVLSAPPLPAEGPTPIRPTPRFDSKVGAKAEAPMAAPAEETPPPAEITADSPPPGYTPPAKLPN